MTPASAIHLFGLLCGVVLLGYGAWFLIAPQAATAGTFHQLTMLPYVMGGRYFFFGALLIAALLYGDATVLSFLLAGFAGLGLFDAVLYWNASPLPHAAVGVIAGLASVYFLSQRKGTQ